LERIIGLVTTWIC